MVSAEGREDAGAFAVIDLRRPLRFSAANAFTHGGTSYIEEAINSRSDGGCSPSPNSLTADHLLSSSSTISDGFYAPASGGANYARGMSVNLLLADQCVHNVHS